MMPAQPQTDIRQSPQHGSYFKLLLALQMTSGLQDGQLESCPVGQKSSHLDPVRLPCWKGLRLMACSGVVQCGTGCSHFFLEMLPASHVVRSDFVNAACGGGRQNVAVIKRW